MRYYSIESFEKHLSEALPHHPSFLYAIFLPHCFEREWIWNFILTHLKKSHMDWGEVKTFSASQCSMRSFIAEMVSPSLFSSSRILIYDEIEKLKKEDLLCLISYLQSPLPQLLIILGANSLLHGVPFYEKVKKEIVMLDLISEKPWDRQKRLIHWLLNYARTKGKALTMEDGTFLLAAKKWNFSCLIPEMDKLITYIGERKKIDRKDIMSLTSIDSEYEGWKLSEMVIWGGSLSFAYPIDPSSVQILIGQLRYQLHLGLTLTVLLASHQEDQVQRFYPKLRGKTVEKYLALAKNLTSSYFIEGLHNLFDIELTFRTGGVSWSILLDIFRVKLQQRRAHVYS